MSQAWDLPSGSNEINATDEQAPREINVGSAERVVSTALGAGLALFGLSRRSVPGLLMAGVGAVLVQRGVTGHCGGYASLGIRGDDAHATSHPLNRMLHTERSITINKPVEDVYRSWRDLDPLRDAIPLVKQVTKLSDDRSHWIADAPRGREVEWYARLVDDRPNECLAWESLEGSDVTSKGRVTFRRAPGGRGTEVHLSLDYGLPLGLLGAAAAKLSGSSPADQVEDGLRRFKQLLETGEIASADGPAGQRGPISRWISGKRAVRNDEASLGEVRSQRTPHWPRGESQSMTSRRGEGGRSPGDRGTTTEPSPLPPGTPGEVGGF